MTTLTALARAKAVIAGRAQPTKKYRHVHLSERPLVLVFAQLAGEACAPLAALAGADRDKPRLFVVYEPRNRTQRFEFAADLAATVLAYLDSYADPDSDPGEQPYPDAPQLIVPNIPTVSFLRLLGRSTRFRQVTGEYAVPEAVPLLGHWLSYYAERAEVTPSALLLPMTAALTDHWVTGQSATEDAHLGALLGWVDPPPGITGREAARLAEDPIRCPPAGPVTDPTFDNDELAPILDGMREAAQAGDGVRLARTQAAMDRALRRQLEPTWAMTWRAVDLLRELPEAAHVDRRWADDRWSFTNQVAWRRGGGSPQPKRDSAVAAARRLARLERDQQRLAVERAFDDPLVMAEYRMTGEAFAGTVVSADPERQVNPTGRRAKLRPMITVATTDPVLFARGDVLSSPDRPKQKAKITDIVEDAGRTLVTLELEGGMGGRLAPEPGSVPAVDEELTYTSLKDGFQPLPKFPDRENTPWTHGGPPEHVPPDEDGPEIYLPSDADANEDWS